MLWNSNGLQKHLTSLQLVLDTRNIDICLISETHFTKETYVTLKNYQIYHTIHPKNCARGGSAVIVKNSVKHYEDEKLQTDEFQATSITIETYSHQKLTITSVYSPPRYSVSYEQYKKLILRHKNKFIMGGDFNSKNIQWGSRLTTTKGRELLMAMQATGCDSISTSKPTYWPTDTTKIPDLLDFFILHKVSKSQMIIDEGFDLCSDHSPVYLSIFDTALKEEQAPYLCSKSTDWNYFRALVQDSIQPQCRVYTADDLDEEVLSFTQKIQMAAWQSTPQKKAITQQPMYPPYIKQMVLEKRKLRKKWQQTRCPFDKAKLNNMCKKLTNSIQKIDNDRLKISLQKLTHGKDTNYSLWKCTKKFSQPKKQDPPLKQSDGTWAKSNSEKAKLFSEHLENTFTPNPSSNSTILENVMQDSTQIASATASEIELEIKSLKRNKSPGFDLITSEVLIELPQTAIAKLTALINGALLLKHFPTYWKVAEVIMIQKPGKPPNEISSYRPISLLPILSKLLEKIILKRMRPIIIEKNIIPNHQFGFRPEHSTIEQVHRICDTIERTLENKEVCSTVFLDVSQAFDKVWHEGLLHKVRKYFPMQLSQIMESYLSSRYFRIKYHDSYSNLKLIQAGVPQGSILGPILYLIYTYDIPCPRDSMIATFADDTAILSTGKNATESTTKTQNAINQIVEWTIKWGINLNHNKSVHVDFTNNRISHHVLTIFNKTVPYSNSAKYLGMNLDAKLRWKEHIKKKKQELDIRYRELYWLLGEKSHISLHNKLMIYKQVLVPIWSYGIQLWGCSHKSNIKIIQTFQNKVLRRMVNAPWYIRNSDLHRDLGIDTVDEIITKYAIAHHTKLQSHKNEEAARLFYDSITERRLLRTKPIDLLGGSMPTGGGRA